MATITFKHEKEFAKKTGKLLRMKSLITIHKRQYIECYEELSPVSMKELTEVRQINKL